MNDTNQKIAAIYRDMLLQRSGEERLRMGFGMFQFSRSLVRAAVRDQHRDQLGSATLSPGDETAEIFRRTYGCDFDEATTRRIMQHLATQTSGQPREQ